MDLTKGTTLGKGLPTEPLFASAGRPLAIRTFIVVSVEDCFYSRRAELGRPTAVNVNSVPR
jgi:hypothetical protein